jgi:hypothetical protein
MVSILSTRASDHPRRARPNRACKPFGSRGEERRHRRRSAGRTQPYASDLARSLRSEKLLTLIVVLPITTLTALSPVQPLQSRIDRSRRAPERACHFCSGHVTLRHFQELLFFLLCPTRRRASRSRHSEPLRWAPAPRCPFCKNRSPSGVVVNFVPRMNQTVTH